MREARLDRADKMASWFCVLCLKSSPGTADAGGGGGASKPKRGLLAPARPLPAGGGNAVGGMTLTATGVAAFDMERSEPKRAAYALCVLLKSRRRFAVAFAWVLRRGCGRCTVGGRDSCPESCPQLLAHCVGGEVEVEREHDDAKKSSE